MLSPLIPDIRHPKWAIVVKLLEIIASPKARKIAGRLKTHIPRFASDCLELAYG
jgi:hypothetical protein